LRKDVKWLLSVQRQANEVDVPSEWKLKKKNGKESDRALGTVAVLWDSGSRSIQSWVAALPSFSQGSAY
jgi:hypothetical protein